MDLLVRTPPGTGPDPPRSGLVEPVGRRVLALLRRAVLDHADEQRRVHPPVVHVGTPGSTTRRLVLGDQRLDHALRTDALEAMVRAVTAAAARTGTTGTEPVLVWLTRSGSAETRDVDLAWLAAARAAAAELAVALPMVVVTRRSWHDPATGVYRDWCGRLRRGVGPG